MRARFPPRALLAALTLLGPASRGAGSLSPSLTSEDPMRLDLEMNVTRAGDVTVLVWEDTYEEGVAGEPMTVVIDLATGWRNEADLDAVLFSQKAELVRLLHLQIMHARAQNADQTRL